MNSEYFRQFISLPPRTEILNRLWDFQHSKNYISDSDVTTLAKEYNISEVEVEGVASFYHFFHRKPAGKYVIYLNNSMTSQIKGFKRILEAFERETSATVGSTDPTGTFGLYLTPCIGLSDQEPAALINFHPFVNLNSLKVREIITQLKKGVPVEEICDEPEENLRYTPENKPSLFFSEFKIGKSISKLTDIKPEGVIEALRLTKLAGRGGAFYPTWMKWQAAADEKETKKVVVCNADEGEPGTFKDRVLMQRVPESMIEGMIICAYTIGASFGLIYLRGEYTWLKQRLEQAIKLYRDKGLLGENCGGITDFHFDIKIQMGAGSYVCGEETALLESAEGKRGEPRTRWFFPVQKGFLNLPTVVNNVETFCAAARIINMGADKYLTYGIPKSPGTKVISVSGDCKYPGIYEIEWGMTLRELLQECGAEDPYFIQESGPSGTVHTLDEQDQPFALFSDFFVQHIRCGGALTVYNKSRDIITILLNYADFYKHESCGICTPCRAGNFIIERKLERVRNGVANRNDIDELKEWGVLMRNTSRCGLGKTATNSLINTLDKFGDYFEKIVQHNGSDQSLKFDLEAATRDYEEFKD
ncbi:MAG: NAD(P)H-dependent oxidoreductase subunit E [Balneolaceae bacterium]|nr:NAD(P)H-dependent oxidoreductase subunit E [Balneolaceae bacterium]